MRVFGIDFTSSPSGAKPITCAVCRLEGEGLALERMDLIETLDGFAEFLATPGPWVAGFDFPFCQPRPFLAGIGWRGTDSWAGYVGHVATLDRPGFRAELMAYRVAQPPGRKHHKRAVDRSCRSQSPQTIDYTPVGLMFHAGAPLLLASGAHLPGLRSADPSRICIEAYPGVAVEALTGRRGYKSDTKARQTKLQRDARLRILSRLCGEAGRDRYGIAVQPPALDLTTDPTGDQLDALICAVQAAWAHRNGYAEAGPPWADPLEGWIADPSAGPVN